MSVLLCHLESFQCVLHLVVVVFHSDPAAVP